MIGRPTITNPIGSALLSFTWTKSAAIGYGGTLTDLYSDWEIASDNLHSALLFSSYLDTEPYDSIYFPGSVGINVDSPLTYLHDGVTKWTIDVAFSITSIPAVVHNIIGNFTNNTQGIYPYLHVFVDSTGKLVCVYSGTSGTYLPIFVSSAKVPLSSIVKVRITFDGSVLSVVINGKLSGISVKGSFIAGTSSTTNMCIGKYPVESYSLVGNIYGLRITKGIVRKQEDYNLPLY